MRLISDTQEAIRVLALGGEIDLNFAPILRTLLEEKTAVPSKALVLDLTEATFIDSSGIAAIIHHLRNATRTSRIFCIGGMSPAVKEIFEVIHLEKAMPVFETRDAALQAIDKDEIAAPPEPLFAPVD
jgi:anti-sigma B factor antagonist